MAFRPRLTRSPTSPVPCTLCPQMSTKVAQANLTDAVKELRFRWERARSEWDDHASRRFEKEVLAPLEPMVIAALKSLEHVNELMIQARRECEDNG